MEIKCFYGGEFGTFNIIMGFIEKHIEKNPKDIFKITTYPDYFCILDHIFPNKFILEKIILEHNDSKRCRHAGLSCAGSKNLAEVVRVSPDYLKNYSYISRPISRKISIDCYNIVSVCCRKRVFNSIKNLSRGTWDAVLKIIRNCWPKCKIIFHGLPEETYSFSMKNTYTCKNIYEAISFLNISKVCVSPVSGYGQFAANCNCNSLQIGHIVKNTQRVDFDPFGKINILYNLKELGSLYKILPIFSTL